MSQRINITGRTEKEFNERIADLEARGWQVIHTAPVEYPEQSTTYDTNKRNKRKPISDFHSMPTYRAKLERVVGLANPQEVTKC